MGQEIDDLQLIQSAGNGDRDAFGALVQRHHAGVIRFIHQFLGAADAHAAEDLAQDVFLAAWQSAPSFQPRAKVRTWLLRIASNKCLNYRRGRLLRFTVLFNDQECQTKGTRVDRESAAAECPEKREIAREQAAVIRKAMATLPPKQRAAILLRHLHRLSHAEMAEILGASRSAVESLLFRGRRKLAQQLEPHQTEISLSDLRGVGIEAIVGGTDLR